jgi:polysaccharide chain length determinant protein (PEP-CTERM system associated)
MLGHRPLILEDYVAILKRRGWMIAIPAVIIPIIAVAISYHLTPIYTSQTLVLIEPQTVPDSYVKPVIAETLDSRLASMKEQILSRSRLEPIIKQFNLGDASMNMDDKVASTRKDIGITPIHSEVHESGGLPGFFISFAAADPHTAQLVCREITSLFVSENLQAREQSAEGTTQFLKGQLNEAKNDLDSQDAKLAAFQREYMGTLPEEQEPNMNMLNSLNAQLEAATQALARMEQDKSLEEALLAQESREVPALGQLGQKATPLTQELELQKLQSQEADLATRYTADYPDVIATQRKIEELRKEMSQVPAPTTSTSVIPAAAGRSDSPGIQLSRAQVMALDQGIQQKKHDQVAIQSQIRLYQDRIQTTPLVAAKMKELTRDHQTAQDFYDSLLTKMNQSQMATDLERRQEGEQFRVMDDANLPDEPTFPKRMVFAGGGFVLGFGLGLLFVALLEYRDTSLRTERDIWAFTKLPTLGTIALVGKLDEAEGAHQSIAEPFDNDVNPTSTSLANAGG